MINNLCKNINESIKKANSVSDILELSSYAHLQLLTIHLFVDGNGRSARLLQNYIMLSNNLPLLVLRHESRHDYINAIIKSRETDNLKYFSSFIISEFVYHLQSKISHF